MVFTAASFTVTVISTIISVLGFILQSDEDDPRFVRAGWLLLAILGIAYIAGMAAILAPHNLPLIPVPRQAVLVTLLLLGVGVVGTLISATLALRGPRVAPTGSPGCWVTWGRVGLILIPLITVLALFVWL